MDSKILKIAYQGINYYLSLWRLEINVICSNAYQLIYDNIWQHMATENWVNIGSGNGLLPDGTKPLPQPMLTYHQKGVVTFFWGQFHSRYLSYQSL